MQLNENIDTYIDKENKIKKIALIGNPNSGKTTLFNLLTGSAQYVGNWPGVTVEKKEGNLKGFDNIIITDLPGIYSLSPYTPEEMVTRNYLVYEKPDVIINILDATNIERNLYLSTQLIEVGIPVIMALNMMDVVKRNGDIIDINHLTEHLGCRIMEMSALKETGISEVIRAAAEIAVAETGFENKIVYSFAGDVEAALKKISDLIKEFSPEKLLRWYTIKFFERDQYIKAQLKINEKTAEHIEEIIKESEKLHDDDSESIITNERYNYITSFVHECVQKKNTTDHTFSDKIDKVMTNRILALPIFIIIMFLVYYLSISSVGGMASNWVNDNLFGEYIPNAVRTFLETVKCAEWLQSLVLDSIIAGVGGVIGFLPQMAILFLLLALLEDCGYMARIAFIMDKIFKKFGLSGKSFIPILIGAGCGVPGVMASRTIDNESDRKMTIITTTFMPCGAKMPIIALISGVMFKNSWLIAASAYVIGISAIMISGLMLKKIKIFKKTPSLFVMELPPYHMPSFKHIMYHTWDRIKSFIKKAGTIIFTACIITWALSNFNFKFQMVGTSESILATLGSLIAPLFIPLGWGNWEAAVATLTGLVAKENLVGTLGVLISTSVNTEVAANGLYGVFTPLSAYSFLLFNLLCAPCVAAMGAIKKEMNSLKWTLFAIGYQTVFAYAVALCMYQISILFNGSWSIFTVLAALVIAVFIYMLIKPSGKARVKITKKV